jgi:transcription termination factor Rho
MATTERDVLQGKVLPELQAIASSMGVQGYQRLRKADLIGAIIAKAQGVEFVPSTRPARSRRSAPAEPTLIDAAPGDQPTLGEADSGTSGDAGDGGDAGDSGQRRRTARRGRGGDGDQAAGQAADGEGGPATGTPADAATTVAASANGSVAVAAPAQEAGGQPAAPRDAAAAAGDGEARQARDEAEERRDTGNPSAPAGTRTQPGEQGQARQDQAGQAGGQPQQGQGGQAHGGGTRTQSQAPDTRSGSPSTDSQQAGGGGGTGAQTQQGQQAQGQQAQGQPDGQGRGDQGPRRDWNPNQGQGGGNRWDQGQQQQGGGRRGRNRNRNRNRNRQFADQGGVAVLERPDLRGTPAGDDRPEVVRTGTLDIRSQDGYGFLRVGSFLPGPEDVYVPLSMIRRLGLRRGDEIEGTVKLPRDSEKYAALSRVDKVNGMDPEEARNRKDFKDLTPLYPQERLRLEHNPTEISTRVMDLMCPIGKGQRGLIVSPPKAGKTMLMKQIANAITDNNPECVLIILLVDERPEEVTDMQRSTKAQVIYSTFDRPSEDHCQVSELTIERAKRLVEYDQDVVILLDGITRLSRAYNLATPASGKILSGGVDSSALYPPKRFFGAARNLENGGSLTILATALVDTGSRMDEVIFEEFKGTGNMEVRLDRKLSERRIFPALDVDASSTRKEELLLTEEELVVAWKLRRVLGALDPAQALEMVVDRMRQSKTNAEFVRMIQRANIS